MSETAASEAKGEVVVVVDVCSSGRGVDNDGSALYLVPGDIVVGVACRIQVG